MYIPIKQPCLDCGATQAVETDMRGVPWSGAEVVCLNPECRIVGSVMVDGGDVHVEFYADEPDRLDTHDHLDVLASVKS